MNDDWAADINPIENGVQQAYIDIREALELILLQVLPHEVGDQTSTGVSNEVLISLDDAVSVDWDKLMLTFWRGVKQDIELMEEGME